MLCFVLWWLVAHLFLGAHCDRDFAAAVRQSNVCGRDKGRMLLSLIHKGSTENEVKAILGKDPDGKQVFGLPCRPRVYYKDLEIIIDYDEHGRVLGSRLFTSGGW